MLSRNTLQILNLAFFLVGCSIIILGIWSITQKESSQLWDSKFGHIINADSLKFAWIALIVAGILIVIIGFIGVWGSIQNDKMFLLVYCVILFLLIVFQIASYAYIMAKPAVVREKFVKIIEDAIEASNKESLTGNIPLINSIQVTFKCCACKSIGDYTNRNATTIESCYFNNRQDYYKDGCCSAIPLTLANNLPNLSFIYTSMLTFEIICLVISVRTLTLIPDDEIEEEP